MLFLVEDNGYAISVPVEIQTPGGDISRARHAASRPEVLRVDGTDFLDSYRAMRRGGRVTRAAGKGPALVHARVTRPYSHSLSDDERLYKTPKEREDEAQRDPLRRFAEFLTNERIASDAELQADRRRGGSRGERGGRASAAGRETAERHGHAVGLLARTSIPAPQRSPRQRSPLASQTRWWRPSTARFTTRWRATRRSIVFGEDVADATRAAVLSRGAGQGRRLQGDAWPAAAFRRRPRLQLAARRGQHHRARRRHGDARPEAGRRDPVLRLHLAGDEAAAQRDVDAAVPLGQQLLVPDRRARPDRRLPARRRDRTTASRARASSRTARASASRSRRTRSTPRGCCARRSAATIR